MPDPDRPGHYRDPEATLQKYAADGYCVGAAARKPPSDSALAIFEREMGRSLKEFPDAKLDAAVKELNDIRITRSVLQKHYMKLRFIRLRAIEGHRKGAATRAANKDARSKAAAPLVAAATAQAAAATKAAEEQAAAAAAAAAGVKATAAAAVQAAQAQVATAQAEAATAQAEVATAQAEAATAQAAAVRATAKPEIGMRVLGLFDSTWDLGTIVKVHENGKFNVSYDDGTPEIDVKWGRDLRPAPP